MSDQVPSASKADSMEHRWADELRDRIRAVRAGEMKMIPMEQALEEAERLLADDGEIRADR